MFRGRGKAVFSQQVAFRSTDAGDFPGTQATQKVRMNFTTKWEPLMNAYKRSSKKEIQLIR